MGGANQFQNSSSKRVNVIFVDKFLSSTETCADTKFRM